jgi:hypothetical protein
MRWDDQQVANLAIEAFHTLPSNWHFRLVDSVRLSGNKTPVLILLISLP